jgi:hypothetical protein
MHRIAAATGIAVVAGIAPPAQALIGLNQCGAGSAVPVGLHCPHDNLLLGYRDASGRCAWVCRPPLDLGKILPRSEGGSSRASVRRISSLPIDGGRAGSSASLPMVARPISARRIRPVRRSAGGPQWPASMSAAHPRGCPGDAAEAVDRLPLFVAPSLPINLPYAQATKKIAGIWGG